MSDAATPRITVLDDGRIVLRTPYNERFIERLKEIEPREDRAWDPVTHVWLIAGRHRERVVELVLKYWSALTISGADGDRVVSREGTFAQERLL